MAKKRRIKNPVARTMETYNRPATHKDKTKYNKKDKSYKKDLGPFSLSALLFAIFFPRTTSL